MKIKKVNELNEGSGTDIRIHLLSRYLSDMFYPSGSKNRFPILCQGFSEQNEDDYEVWFKVWDEIKNDYANYPVTTIMVPKYVIKR